MNNDFSCKDTTFALQFVRYFLALCTHTELVSFRLDSILIGTFGFSSSFIPRLPASKWQKSGGLGGIGREIEMAAQSIRGLYCQTPTLILGSICFFIAAFFPPLLPTFELASDPFFDKVIIVFCRHKNARENHLTRNEVFSVFSKNFLDAVVISPFPDKRRYFSSLYFLALRSDKNSSHSCVTLFPLELID